MAKKEEKILGYAKFGAFMHRDNGGKMKISAYTAVNKPLAVDVADETTRIAERTYKIVEEERPELNGNKFYEKEVWNEQSGSGDATQTKNVTDAPEGNTPNNGDGLSPLKVLKNFVDNIAADNRTQWIVICACIVLGAAAIAIALIK
jgi:hypothetical protein